MSGTPSHRRVVTRGCEQQGRELGGLHAFGTAPRPAFVGRWVSTRLGWCQVVPVPGGEVYAKLDTEEAFRDLQELG